MGGAISKLTRPKMLFMAHGEDSVWAQRVKDCAAYAGLRGRSQSCCPATPLLRLPGTIPPVPFMAPHELGHRRSICPRAPARASAGRDNVLVECTRDREGTGEVEDQVIEPIRNPITTRNHDEAGWGPIGIDQDLSPAWIGCTSAGKQLPGVRVTPVRNLGVDGHQCPGFARDQHIWAECGEVA